MRRLDDFVPKNHPLRSVRTMVNAALKNIEGSVAVVELGRKERRC